MNLRKDHCTHKHCVAANPRRTLWNVPSLFSSPSSSSDGWGALDTHWSRRPSLPARLGSFSSPMRISSTSWGRRGSSAAAEEAAAASWVKRNSPIAQCINTLKMTEHKRNPKFFFPAEPDGWDGVGPEVPPSGRVWRKGVCVFRKS